MRHLDQIRCFIIFFMMVGFDTVIEPVVTVLLTGKWLYYVYFSQLASLSYAFYPVHNENLQGIKAVGDTIRS